MEEDVVINKQASKGHLENCALIFGVLSLVGLTCCLPCMGIVGGIGFVCAILSKGGDEKMTVKARNGAIFSMIGLLVSVVLTVTIVGTSFCDLVSNVRKNPEYLDDMFATYNKMYEDLCEEAGGEPIPEYYESVDKVKELLNSYIGNL